MTTHPQFLYLPMYSDSEIVVLSTLLENYTVRKCNYHLLEFLKPKYFTDFLYRNIYSALLKYIRNDLQVIDFKIFAHEVCEYISTDNSDRKVDKTRFTFSFIKDAIEKIMFVDIKKKLLIFSRCLNLLIEFSMSKELTKSIESIPLDKRTEYIITHSKNLQKYEEVKNNKLNLINSEKRISMKEIFEDMNFDEDMDNTFDGKDTDEDIIPTGFDDLDNEIGGFERGEYSIIGARTSMGKTALFLNLANNIARNKETDEKVLIISCEMTRKALTRRLITINSRIETKYIKRKKFRKNLSKDKIKLIRKVKSKISEANNIFIFKPRSKEMPYISEYIRNEVKEKGITIIFIDYIQKLSNSDGYNKNHRNYELGIISDEIQNLAQELNIPIICLGQLSRSADNRADKTPVPSDLKDSGDLEQDVDKLFLIYNPNYYNKKSNIGLSDDNDYSEAQTNTEVVQLILAKNRDGKTFSVNLKFEKNIGKFSNLTKEDTSLIN